MAIVVRLLRPEDDRRGFRSGDVDLDRFFERYAGQNQFRLYVGATYVAESEGAIVGFATVSPGEIEVDELPATARKKYPNYPLPILRLARLAVDERRQGKGIGGQLLATVLRLALQMADEVGCLGVVVDAKPNAVSFYADRSFIALEVVQGASAARPQPVPMFLAVKAIKANQ